MQKLFFGVMTGTSADAIDVVLASIQESDFKPIDSQSLELSEIKQDIKSLCSPGPNELFRAHSLGVLLSQMTAKLVNEILARNNIKPFEVSAIGFHGQTVRHHPDANPPFSIQIGCASTLAHLTKIKTITNFRMADIAAGGQGAPLVPAFHKHVFQSDNEERLIINIGGIANITLLPSNPNQKIIGFDTGPGNALLDEWVYLNLEKEFDENGDWAKSGKVIPDLLTKMMNDKYIQKEIPKSTGKEYFNLSWLESLLGQSSGYKTEDIQRTLLEFTCTSLSKSIDTIKISNSISNPFIYLCGGGINNSFLIDRLSELNPHTTFNSTSKLGIHPQQVEASAFAWLASRTNSGMPGNLMSATGASEDKILGGIYLP